MIVRLYHESVIFILKLPWKLCIARSFRVPYHLDPTIKNIRFIQDTKSL